MSYRYFITLIETVTRSNRKIDHCYNKHSIHIENGTDGKHSMFSLLSVTDVQPSGKIYTLNDACYMNLFLHSTNFSLLKHSYKIKQMLT
jgi:hypothetical protein